MSKYKVVDGIAVTNGVQVFRCATPFYAERLAKELNKLQVGHMSDYYWLFVHLLGDVAKLSGTGKTEVIDKPEHYEQLANECIALLKQRIEALEAESRNTKSTGVLGKLPATEPFTITPALQRALLNHADSE